MKKIRLGCLGAGSLAQIFANCYAAHPHIEIVAFADLVPQAALAAAEMLNREHGTHAKAFGSYEAMLQGCPMDALFIASDPDTQVPYAVDAMHRGLHVLASVPVAYTLEQCRDLVRAVQKTGAKYQPAEQTRYWNFIREWRRMAQDGEFGKIYYVEGEYLHYEPHWDLFRHKKTHLPIRPTSPEDFDNPDHEMSWRYRTFQNPIYYMPHELSPLLSVTGGRIEKVSCLSTRLGSYDNPLIQARDLQVALMKTDNDVTFSLKAGFTTPHGPKNDLGAHWYQIKGSKATVETSRSTLDTMKLYPAGGEWQEMHWGTSDPHAPEHIRNTTHGGVDYYPIESFVSAIVHDTAPAMDVYAAVETAAPVIVAVESAAQGGVLLDVPNFRS